MPADFPAQLRELCDRHGILWIDDEVQAGVGRTGPVWAIEHYDAQPDLLVSGKSLGGGLPLAGVTGPAAIMDASIPAGFGGTFGGNPVSCAAANVVLEQRPGARRPARPRGARHAHPAAARGHRPRASTRSARCAGSARCSRSRLVRDREIQDPAPELHRRRRSPRRARRACCCSAAACTATSSACCRRSRSPTRSSPAGWTSSRPRSCEDGPHAPARPALGRRVPAGGRDPAARPRRQRALAVRVDRAQGAGEGRYDRRRARRSSCAGTARTARRTAPSWRSATTGRSRGRRSRASSPTSRPTSGTSATPRCGSEPRLIEALAARGITDMDKVLIDVWGYRGFLVPERYSGRRIGWTDTWFRSSPGLQPVREPGQRPALRRRPQLDGAAGDRGHVLGRQAAGVMGEYVPRHVPDLRLREDLKPVEITQPERRLLHARRPRAGVAELDAAARLQPPRRARPAHARLRRARSIAHRISLAEMVVPYRDPSPDHFRRTAYDIGEWGLGFMTQSLELGCDCLGEIRYVDAVAARHRRRAVHDHERRLHPRGGRRRPVEARRPPGRRRGRAARAGS